MGGAIRDPSFGNLGRIHIVKDWLGRDGKAQECVYSVVWSGNCRPAPKTGTLPAVGNSVDVAIAMQTNTIGAPELSAIWKDPSVDPEARTFYYARVIEIPTPRSTNCDTVRFNIRMSADIPITQQAHAATSPIWYTP